MNPTLMKTLRWTAAIAVLLVMGWIFRDDLAFVREGISRVRSADPVALIVVTVAAFLALFAMGEVMRRLMAAGGLRVPARETQAITFASNAWSTTLPAGTAFSAILTYHVQRKWGASVMLCGWFLVVSSVISTMWLVLISIGAVIFLKANMQIWSLVGTMAAMVVVTVLVFWATNNPRTIERWLHRQRLFKGKLREGLLEQVRNLDSVHLSRKQFILVSLYSLSNRLMDIVAMWACVWAVTGKIPGISTMEDHTTMAGVALAYITAKLAGSAQVTPGGVGTVEAATIATLVATGMTAVDATSAAIIYRLISFVLITAIGWVVYVVHYARRGISYASLSKEKITPITPSDSKE